MATNKDLWEKQLQLNDAIVKNLQKINHTLFGHTSKQSGKLNTVLVTQRNELEEQFKTTFSDDFMSENQDIPRGKC